MRTGFNKTGRSECAKSGGCIRPAPPALSEPADIVAWEVFRRAHLERHWVKVGDSMVGYRRDRLDLAAVKEITEENGFELTDYLRSRISVCQNWVLDDDQRRRDFVEAPAGSSVN